MKLIIKTTSLAVLIVALTGCQQLPGTKGQQGAVIGGTGGAIAGAAIAKNDLLGALIGGAAGAAGGYLLGANSDRILGRDKDGARKAIETAQTSPATAEQARNSQNADLNNDGFVTLDEVVAMKSAGLTDEQMLERLRATNQVFELSADQQQQLRARGVSDSVINQMATMNRELRDQLTSGQTNSVISQPPPQ